MLINTGHVNSKGLITDNKIKEIKKPEQIHQNMNTKDKQATATTIKLRISMDKTVITQNK